MTTTIHQGDCKDVLPTLPANSVQCVITSPPYWGLRDYGVDGQLGLEPTPELYVEHLVEIFRDVKRVLRDDGVVFLNLGDSYANNKVGNTNEAPDKRPRPYFENGTHKMEFRKTVPPGLKPKDLCGIPWRVAFALQADGWWLRSDIIWHKPNCMPESVTDRPTKAHEYVFLLTKSARYFYDADSIKEDCSPNTHSKGPEYHKMNKTVAAGQGIKQNESWEAATWGPVTSRNRRTVWTVPTQPYSGAHFATFPPALIEPMIKAGTSERGRCPECGAPWERVVEKVDTGQKQKTGSNWDTGPGAHGTFHREGRETMPADQPVLVPETIGWQPTCDHHIHGEKNSDIPIPCTVLDPFAGAGTVGLVADRLQRDAILIELNPEYAEMARRRIEDEAPMFTSVQMESRQQG